MKTPRDCPDWIASFVNDQKESIYSEIIVAKTSEQLWSVQGRAKAILTLENDIEMRAQEEIEQAREIAGRISAHGN